MNLGGSWHKKLTLLVINPMSAYPRWLTRFRATDSLRVPLREALQPDAAAGVHPRRAEECHAACRRAEIVPMSLPAPLRNEGRGGRDVEKDDDDDDDGCGSGCSNSCRCSDAMVDK